MHVLEKIFCGFKKFTYLCSPFPVVSATVVKKNLEKDLQDSKLVLNFAIPFAPKSAELFKTGSLNYWLF